MTCVRRFAPRAAPRVRLVCLPHAGGTASAFRTWGALLPDDVDVIAVQYPGRHDRMADPFLPELVDLAEAVVDEIPRDLPVVYLGHSMGALVAYEMARVVEPDELIVSAPPAATAPGARGYADDDALLDAVRALGGSGVGLLDNPVIAAIALPAIRHDFGMVARYRAAVPAPLVLRCPVTALVGRDDPVCPPDAAQPWAGRTTGPFALRAFPGGHHYLEQHPADVLAVVADLLGRYRHAPVGGRADAVG